MDGGAGERAWRAELAELRVRLAERDRALVVVAEENAALRADNTALRDKLAVLAGQLAELQRRLGQNPRNSDRPPSSEGYEKPAPKSRRRRSGRRPGGQPGHGGTTLAQLASPDQVVVHAPRRCGCGRSLRRAPVRSVERRQVFDLPEIALVVTEHRLEHRVCRCGAVTMAEVPAGVGAPAQYGPGVRALATYLLAGQHLPLARAAELVSELVAAPVSAGSLAGWYVAAGDRLGGFCDRVRAGLAAAPVLGADETGGRIEAATNWLHVARTDTLTLLTAHHRRGVAAMTEAGVLPALSADTVLVHDFWVPYWRFPVTHAVCGAHLERELTAAAEVPGQAGWAAGLAGLLVALNDAVHEQRQAGASRLPAGELAGYQRRYEKLIAAGWAANPRHQAGARAGRRRPKHVNLLDRLDRHRVEVLRFATDFRVPFTNNGSEQDIRSIKIRLKIAGSLRSWGGADAFCRLRSYLSTAAKQGMSAFRALRMLHDGTPWMPAIPQTS